MNPKIEKAVDYFCVVGLNDELVSSNGKKSTKNSVITDLELVKMGKEDDLATLTNSKKCKWLNLDGLGRIYLKILYGGDKAPITDINLYRIQASSGGKCITIPGKMGITPVCIRKNNQKAVFKSKKRMSGKETINFYYGRFDLSDFLEHDKEKKAEEEEQQEDKKKTLLCFCYYRKQDEPPLTKIEFIDIDFDKETGKPMKPRTKLKILPYTFNYPRKRSLCYDSRSIVQRKFIPQVISRYPLENRSYYAFPDNIPSFCMTNGLRFEEESAKKQEYQSPKFFSFILTDHEGNRMYCACLVLKENPVYPEIEESLLAFNVTDPKKYVVPKALCIISHYSFINSYKEFLKSLFSIQFAKTPIPIERYVSNFVDEIPVPDKGNILVEYDIGSSSVPFYIPVDQYAPYASSRDIEYTFKCLSCEDVVTLVLQLSLEKKILLVSRFKALLSAVATTLTSLLFPFKWMHVLIPLIPDEMGQFLECPFPFLIGMEKRFFDKVKEEIPEDVITVFCDKGEIRSSEVLPKMPVKEFKNFSAKVRKASSGFFLTSTGREREKELKAVDDAFDFNMTAFFLDQPEVKFDAFLIRDAFLEFYCQIMKNYQAYMISPDKTEGIVTDARDCFKFSSFRSHKDATKPETYIYQLTGTSMFNTFIETRAFKDEDEEEEVAFFDHALKLKKKKKDTKCIGPPVPGKTLKAMTPLDLDIKGETWTYTYFPVLNPLLFNNPRPIQNFIKEANNAIKWKVDNKTIGKMNDSKWAKFLFESIFVLWFYTMSVSLPNYKDDAATIIHYSKTVIDFMKKKLKTIKEIEFIYKKLFEACMKCKLHDEAGKLRDEMKTITFAFQDTNQRTFIPTDGKAMVKKNEEEKKEEQDDDHKGAEISYVLQNMVIFAAAQCLNTTCNYVIKEEEIMSGWQKSMNEYISQCPKCKAKFVPKLTLLTDSEHESLNGKDGSEIQWLPPSCLMKEFTNCIAQRGESILQKEDFLKDHSTIYWNLLFYFKLLKLPYFFLDRYYNENHIQKEVEVLDTYQPLDNKRRSSIVSNKKSTLNPDALSKLNEATRDQNALDIFGRTGNRPPSMYEGVMGNIASDSLGVDTLSQTDSVANPKPRRPGSVVNFGGRGNSAKRSRRGSISQRSNSGSCVGSVSDFERIDQGKKGSSHANKYINRFFSKYCEEFRNFMHFKNQDLALSDLRFDEMPEELAKQFSNVAKEKIDTTKHTPIVKTNSERPKMPQEANTAFKADDIISGVTLSKINSNKEDTSKFKAPLNIGSSSMKIHRPPKSPMKVIKKSRLRIKKSSRMSNQSIEFSESQSQAHN